MAYRPNRVEAGRGWNEDRPIFSFRGARNSRWRAS